MEKENKPLLRSVLDLNQAPKEEPVKLYDRDGIPVATISNAIDLIYARIQIQKNEIPGCYIIFRGNRYDILSNGRLEEYPKGLMDAHTDLIVEFLCKSKDIKKYEPQSKIIDVKNCPPENSVSVFDNEDNLIVRTNQIVKFDWVRAEIAKRELEGCYIIFEDKKYPISKYGHIDDWPRGLFGVGEDLLDEIISYDYNWKRKKTFSNLIDKDDCPCNDYVDMYDNEDKLICYTNSDLMFDWVRAQIKEQGLEGCYLVFKGEKIMIDKNGEPEKWPEELFSHLGPINCLLGTVTCLTNKD